MATSYNVEGKYSGLVRKSRRGEFLRWINLCDEKQKKAIYEENAAQQNERDPVNSGAGRDRPEALTISRF